MNDILNEYVKKCENFYTKLIIEVPMLKNLKHLNFQEFKEWERDLGIQTVRFTIPEFMRGRDDIHEMFNDTDIENYRKLCTEDNFIHWHAHDTFYSMVYYVAEIDKYISLSYDYYKNKSKFTMLTVLAEKNTQVA